LVISRIKIFPVACLIIGLTIPAAATSAQLGRDYNELNNPKKINKKAWSKTGKPLYASFASKDIHFPKNEVPTIPDVNFWGETGWRGERISALLLLWSGTGASEVALHVSDFETSSGQKISAARCTMGFLRYVMVDEFGTDGCAPRRSNQYDSSLVADVIDYKAATSIAGRTVQPVWFTLNIPPEAATGKYKGFITVTAKELTEPITLTTNIFVRNHLLPPASQWSFRLNMWQNPMAVARYHNLAPWSKAHFDAMRPVMALLAKSGQKSITIPITNNAIGEAVEKALPDEFESMITAIRRVDNTWNLDFTKMDSWVDFMMSLGINQELCCYMSYSPTQTISYFDQASNSVKVQEMYANSKEYNSYLQSMLEQLTAHLKSKGWLSKTTICIKEAGRERLRKFVTTLAKIDSSYAISYTGNYFADVEPNISRYSVAQRQPVSEAQKDVRSEGGRLLCFYSPCSDAHPNTYAFSPSGEAAWVGWYAAANGFGGYTRQAYNSWGNRPLQDARSSSRAAGYYWVAYPGGCSSIRLERLVEGIQDYEKIQILKQYLSRANKVVEREQLQKALNLFTLNNLKTLPAGKMVEEAKITLNSL
jgi:hypothetical protein